MHFVAFITRTVQKSNAASENETLALSVKALFITSCLDKAAEGKLAVNKCKRLFVACALP